jgi:PAS domain S-box-containing protein
MMIKVDEVPTLDEREISQIIFDSISDGVFTVDHECRITSFNKAAERITGFAREEAIGQFCFDVFHSDICQDRCALRHTLSNGESIYNTRVTIIDRFGKKIPIGVSTTMLQNETGTYVGAVEFFRDLSMLENLEEELQKVKQFGKLVSCNPQMQRIFSMLPQIAESECNVLIQGPSGCGKELVAEAIHNFSPRKQNRYIKLNCAALPENLLESELFGYVKGAFTDARRDKPGMFLLAQGGTLLLDEIAEMPVALQSKLLRVLNNGEFQPLGSTRTLHTDARILTATNRNLEDRIVQRRFREDLYYRINVINVKIPPLKERIEDLPMLVEHFAKHFQKKHGKAIKGLSTEVLQRLRMHDFPGNVRELENAIEHAFVLCRGDYVELENLPQRIIEATAPAPKGLPSDGEASIIRESLARHRWNRSQAARDLGMDRSTLWRKMKKLGISEG